MLANLANDSDLVHAFMSGADFHSATASSMLGIPMDKVTKADRKKGKCITGDSYIFSEDQGLVKIKDLSNNREEDTFSDISISVVNRVTEVNKAPSFYYNGFQKVVTIRTRQGYLLGGSEDAHKVEIYDEIISKPAYKKVSEMSVSDKVILFIGGVKSKAEIQTVYGERLDESKAAYYGKFIGGILSGVLKEKLSTFEVLDAILRSPYEVQLSFLKALSKCAAKYKAIHIHFVGQKEILERLHVLLLYLGIPAKYCTLDQNSLILLEEPLSLYRFEKTVCKLGFLQDVKDKKIRFEDYPRVIYGQGSSSFEFVSFKDLKDNLWSAKWRVSSIDTIDHSTEEVFDIFVPKGNQFIANGFVNHNTLNFGLVYGMTKYGLAEKLGVTPDEAEVLMASYFENKPKVKELVDSVKSYTKKKGYVRTYFGRVRWFKSQLDAAPSYHAKDRVLMRAFNTKIQGSAADMAKLSLARAFEAIKPYGDKIRLLSQVHDELNFEVHKSLDLEEVLHVLDQAISFRGIREGWTDIPGDIEIGTCYGQLKSPEEFGIDMEKFLSEVKPTDISRALFEPINEEDVYAGAEQDFKEDIQGSKTSKKEKDPPKKREFLTREGVTSSQKPKEAKETTSTEELLGRLQSSASTPVNPLMSSSPAAVSTSSGQRLDLSKAKFPTSTVLIYLRPGVNEEKAYETLKSFIAEEFGMLDLVIETEGLLYKFPEMYKVSKNNLSKLEGYFDVKLFEVVPKVKITL